ncbi:MAG: preprotein translocase subunit YajC [Pseudobdellovibrio sp.]
MNLLVSLFGGLVFTSVTVLAQVADATTAAPAPAWMQFVPFVIIIGVFYFFLIRPQAKKQKETQSFLTSLKVGDQIITQSGILGRIAAMTDTIVTLEVANTVQIKVLRTQILMSQAALSAKKEGN